MDSLDPHSPDGDHFGEGLTNCRCSFSSSELAVNDPGEIGSVVGRSVVVHQDSQSRGMDLRPRCGYIHCRSPMSNRPPHEPEDPFEGLVLDEDFVLAARKREPSADDRLSRAAALRSNLDERERIRRADRRIDRRLRNSLQRPRYRSDRRPPRTIGRSRRSLAITIVVITLICALVWWELNHRDPVAWQGGDPMMQLIDQQNRPTPATASSDIPLGTPEAQPPGGGPHVFMATQADGTTPVAYDPCRPIPIVMNERTMPSAATGLVTEAIDEISAITGLRFSVEGPTDEGATSNRPTYQPDRYGDRWAPVLIAWTDAQEQPDLAGNIAGVGGSAALEIGDSTRVYVSGIVHLDGPDIDRILERPEGRYQTRAIVLHELGHLIGLNHVDDPNELMYAENNGQTDFGKGDLTGLHALSRGVCTDRL